MTFEEAVPPENEVTPKLNNFLELYHKNKRDAQDLLKEQQGLLLSDTASGLLRQRIMELDDTLAELRQCQNLLDDSRRQRELERQQELHAQRIVTERRKESSPPIVPEKAYIPLDEEQVRQDLQAISPEGLTQVISQFMNLNQEDIEKFTEIVGQSEHLTDYQKVMFKHSLEQIQQSTPEQVIQTATSIKNMPFEQFKAMSESFYGIAGGAFSWSPSLYGEQGTATSVQAENSEQRIAALTQHLATLSREKSPLEWAQEHYQRAGAYLSLTTGDHEENTKRAIEDFNAALTIFTREDMPLRWAGVIGARGSAYAGLQEGDRKKHAELAMADFDASIAIFEREKMDELLATAKWVRNMAAISLGWEDQQNEDQAQISPDTHLNLPGGSSRIVPAAEAFTALAQGQALITSRHGTQEQNIEQAIGEFSKAIDLFTKEKLLIQRAAALGARGETYINRQQGDKVENLHRAVADLNEALATLSYEQMPNEWATVNMVRAMAYFSLYNETQEDAQMIEWILADCNNTLRVFSPKNTMPAWINVMKYRCWAYTVRIIGDQRQNIEQALTDANTLLGYVSRESAANDWAEAHMDRGIAYMRRLAGERSKNYQQAIADFDAALTVFTRESSPTTWARITSNRSLALQEMGIGDTNQANEQVLANFEATLSTLNPEKEPLEWGMIQANYGRTYMLRVAGDQQQNLRKAQKHLDKALQVFSREKTPVQWAMVQVNLGIVTRHLHPQNFKMGSETGYIDVMNKVFATGWDDFADDIKYMQQSIDEAIEHFDLALGVFNKENNPQEWARAHSERALAHSMSMGETRKQHLSQASDDYEAAFTVITSDTMPQQWAIMHLNRGLLCTKDIIIDPKTDALHALADFDAALTVFTPEVMPAKHRHTQLLRSFMLERLEWWEEAHTALRKAREMQRDLVAAALSENSRSDTIANFSYIDMYLRNAQVLLRHKQPDLAEVAIALEEGRAQSMRMALDLDSINVQQIADPDAKKRMQAFISARQMWRKRQHDLLDLSPTATSNVEINEQRAQRLQVLRAAYDAFLEARKDIRQHDDPDFMTPVLTLSGIARSVSTPDEALVYLTSGSYMAVGARLPDAERQFVDGVEGGMAIIILRAVDGSERVRHIALPRLTSNAVSLLIEPDRRRRISIKLEPAMQTLGKIALDELAAALLQEGIRKVAFVTYGRLSLFPLSAVQVTRPDGHTALLGELFEITYAPSARAAEVAKRRTSEALRSRTRQSLLLVANPTPLTQEFRSLPFTEIEIEHIKSIAQGYNYSASRISVLSKGEATKRRVLEKMSGARYAHLAMHGKYNIENPRSSRLILAGDEKIAANERTITLAEVLDGKIQLAGIRLIVLSACETSIIDVRRMPNEVVGLAAGFLQAGVGGVIASLWPVDDRASAALMMRFAQLYLDPQNTWSVARALAEAQRWLREDATNHVLETYDPVATLPSSSRERTTNSSDTPQQEDPDALPFADPYYWAAFVVTGGHNPTS